MALLVSHVVGDVLLQTDWQAVTKAGGLGGPVSRRALGRHLGTYSMSFAPVLAWVAMNRSLFRAVVVGGLVVLPHVVIDDGRSVRAWLRAVKRAPEPSPGLTIAVDQAFHLLSLLCAALVSQPPKVRGGE